MRATLATRATILAIAAAAGVAACASKSGASAPDGDGGTPAGQPRSFRRDVVPIFAASCALQDCHGDPASMLGVHFVIGDPAAIYAELQRESPTAKGAKFVVPGDPSKSFLYAKINGDEGDYTDMCAVAGCGETMPPGTKIPSAQRNTIRQWILEGATDD